MGKVINIGVETVLHYGKVRNVVGMSCHLKIYCITSSVTPLLVWDTPNFEKGIFRGKKNLCKQMHFTVRKLYYSLIKATCSLMTVMLWRLSKG